MTNGVQVAISWSGWLDLIRHMLVYSVASIGGPLGLVSEMHRYLVSQQQWLTDGQFNASVVLAQAAPGPNVLFVALLGWNIGMNAGGYLFAPIAALLSLGGILLPSCTMMFFATKWISRNQKLKIVRAFKQGMSPTVISMLIASGWVLATANSSALKDWPLWFTTASTAVLVIQGRINMFWLLAIGALLGATGIIT